MAKRTLHRKKLTDEEALAIYKSDEPMLVLAARYKVSYNTIWQIKHKITYKHVHETQYV